VKRPKQREKLITVTVSAPFAQLDGSVRDMGMSVSLEMPRGAKLASQQVGVMVATAATKILTDLHMAAYVAYKQKKMNGVKK
jgi:hypothetical protein